ncbi:MAG: hypothetical protein KAS07_06040 [Candidatus Pacebacteria bacterium]|nr:hypothetical protein [Candidatus Paceibacterota bacterium]
MPERNNSGPVGDISGILAPVVILLFLIFAGVWLIGEINQAIPFDLWNMGSGLVIGALAVIVVVYYKYS